MTQDAFKRATPAQKSTYLAQQVGHQLYQQQLAAGIVRAPTTGVSSFPQGLQETASPSMPHASHFMHNHAMRMSPSQSSSNQLGGMNYGGLPMAPPNIFHQNYQNSMASSGRSFSMSAMPTSSMSNQPGLGSPMPTLNSNFHPNGTSPYDYESMRRSFSSTANLTPQTSTMTGDQVTDPSPTKRSMPPSSPTAMRKRVRLSIPGQSLPGEDEAPVLKPSSSSYQLHAPAGLPADDTIDFAASIEAIEAYERDNATELAALSTTRPTSDPQHAAPHDEATQPFPDFQEPARETTDTSNPQLPVSQTSTQAHETAPNNHFGDAILIPANVDEQTRQLSQPSDFNNNNNQQSQTNANQLDDEAKDTTSEPEWDLLADDVFSMP